MMNSILNFESLDDLMVYLKREARPLNFSSIKVYTTREGKFYLYDDFKE